MTKSTTLTVHQPLTPQIWRMIESIAPAMHKSRLFGISSPDAAAVIMLKGYELGLGLSASFEFIHLIQGRPSLAPRGALAILQNHPELAGLKIEDLTDDKGQPHACRVWMKRQSGFEYTVEFSMEDARRAQLVKEDSNWEKYPANMLRWRAVGFCADVVFPDVIGGLKRADELGAPITADGDIIEGQWEEPTSELDPVQKALDGLIEHFGAEVVLEAADGIPPTTYEELQAVAIKLAGEEEE